MIRVLLNLEQHSVEEVEKEWARIARLGGLRRREVGALGLRCGEKAIPLRLVQGLRSCGAHDARRFTHG